MLRVTVPPTEGNVKRSIFIFFLLATSAGLLMSCGDDGNGTPGQCGLTFDENVDANFGEKSLDELVEKLKDKGYLNDQPDMAEYNTSE